MQSDPPLILLIDDEPEFLAYLHIALAESGYQVEAAGDGRAGVLKVRTQQPDLVVLDVHQSEMDSLAVTRQLRAWSKIPVIVLSAANQEQDKVALLDPGADDYLSKPFGLEELLARIRVALRHRADARPEAVFAVGDLKMDLAAHRVFRQGQAVHLTPTEYRMLTTLVRNAGHVLPHSYLLKKVWGPASTQDREYLRVFMASLRRKLEADPARPRYLRTEQGIGYWLAAD